VTVAPVRLLPGDRAEAARSREDGSGRTAEFQQGAATALDAERPVSEIRARVCGDARETRVRRVSSKLSPSPPGLVRGGIVRVPTLRSEPAPTAPRVCALYGHVTDRRRQADLAVLILIINLAASPPHNEPMVISDHD